MLALHHCGYKVQVFTYIPSLLGSLCWLKTRFGGYVQDRHWVNHIQCHLRDMVIIWHIILSHSSQPPSETSFLRKILKFLADWQIKLKHQFCIQQSLCQFPLPSWPSVSSLSLSWVQCLNALAWHSAHYLQKFLLWNFLSCIPISLHSTTDTKQKIGLQESQVIVVLF